MKINLSAHLSFQVIKSRPKIAFKMMFFGVNIGFAQWTLRIVAWNGKFIANHNRKSHGQNCYHIVNKPRRKQ